MSHFRTHLTVLDESAALYPTANAFYIPLVDSESSLIREWQAISYRQFQRDVEHTARFWRKKLTADGVQSRSVIGMWSVSSYRALDDLSHELLRLGGSTYVDALHIYGIARAGYVPQLISLRLPNLDVIFELLAQSKGKALIYDHSFSSIIRSGSVPTHVAVDARESEVADVTLPPSIPEGVQADDPVMILHTSGSTSGRPKLVPCSYSWWNNTITKAEGIMKRKQYVKRPQDVTVWMYVPFNFSINVVETHIGDGLRGSLCHMGQSFMLVGALANGNCMVQFTKQAFSSEELLDMVTRCGLSRITIFPTYLATHFRNSRRDPKVLAALQGLDEILISGLSMSVEDQRWARSNGIRVLDCYASTEVAVMMLSRGEQLEDRLPPLQPIEGVSYSFQPIAAPASTSESGYTNMHSRLVELVVLADSPDCPDRSLRAADGHFHTGDLFLEVSPQRYVFCGRDDDWIKTEVSLRCDTRAIEDNVYKVCGDLIGNCVVVGNGRPSPSVFVEPAVVDMTEQRLKTEIMRRILPFHSRRYIHERVASADFIFVVPKDTLPRTATKGNIRRRAVEQTFQAELDRAYAQSR